MLTIDDCALMVREARKVLGDKDAIFFRRFYGDGRMRPVRINKPAHFI
jgi:hypothetical protein